VINDLLSLTVVDLDLLAGPDREIVITGMIAIEAIMSLRESLPILSGFVLGVRF